MANRPKILHIENDETWIELIQDILADCDYDIQAMKKVNDGIERLKSGEHFDLILVNMNLTKHNENGGVVILEYVCRHRPLLPKIVISGFPYHSFGATRLRKFIERYQLEEIFPKNPLPSIEFRKTVHDALEKKLDVRVRSLHNEIPRYIMHLYQSQRMKDNPRLQLFEFVIDGLSNSIREVTIVFGEHMPYTQKAVYPCLVSQKQRSNTFFLSPVFTDQAREASQIAVTDVRVCVDEKCIWKLSESHIFQITDTIPIKLKQAAEGDSWVHFLISSCITPNSPKVKELARKVRHLWQQGHQGEIWKASNYTNSDALEIARHLRELLKSELITEGFYIPNVPESVGTVQHSMRLPDEILDGGGANCLYYSLLYASVMENLGIQPLLLFMPSHIIPGWKKMRSDKPHTFGLSSVEFIKENSIFIEGTKTSLEVSFEDMLRVGQVMFGKAQELRLRNQPVYLLDIAQLRREGFKPYNRYIRG